MSAVSLTQSSAGYLEVITIAFWVGLRPGLSRKLSAYATAMGDATCKR
jgi:hypothetical protein